MGSRIMHLSIAQVINNKHGFGNDFLIGSITPDVNKNSRTPKELTHFMVKREDGEHDMFPNMFLEEYGTCLNTFQLGYYLHLISDDIWLKTVYKKYILENMSYSKDEALRRFYLDFHYYNGILIKQYKLVILKNNKYLSTGVNEIIDRDISEIIEDFPGLLKKEDVEQYINVCVKEFEIFLLKGSYDGVKFVFYNGF